MQSNDPTPRGGETITLRVDNREAALLAAQFERDRAMYVEQQNDARLLALDRGHARESVADYDRVLTQLGADGSVTAPRGWLRATIGSAMMGDADRVYSFTVERVDPEDEAGALERLRAWIGLLGRLPA